MTTEQLVISLLQEIAAGADEHEESAARIKEKVKTLSAFLSYSQLEVYNSLDAAAQAAAKERRSTANAQIAKLEQILLTLDEEQSSWKNSITLYERSKEQVANATSLVGI